MKIQVILIWAAMILLSCSITQDSLAKNHLENIGKVDQIFFIGQNKQTVFFISQQSHQYGYLDASTGQIEYQFNFQNQTLIRISQSLKVIDFISSNFTLYTLDVQSQKIQTHNLHGLDSSLKQNIKSFAKVDDKLYLLIGNAQVFEISSEGNIKSIQKPHSAVQEFISLIPVKYQGSSHLYLISFDKDQTKSQNNVYAIEYSNGQRLKKTSHLIVGKNIIKSYLNDNSVVIEGDRMNYIFFGGFKSAKRFQGKISQYFNNEFIMDDFALYRPSASTRHDFLVSEDTSSKSSRLRSAISIYKIHKFYQINHQFKGIRTIERDAKNEIKRSWYNIDQSSHLIKLTVQHADNTLKTYIINNSNPYKRGQTIKQAWKIPGSNSQVKETSENEQKSQKTISKNEQQKQQNQSDLKQEIDQQQQFYTEL